MKITRNQQETGRGPSKWFTGDVTSTRRNAVGRPRTSFFEPGEDHSNAEARA